jgi:hypothetical protein
MKIDLKKDNQFISDFELLTEIGCDLSQHFRDVIVPNRRMTLSTHILAKVMENCISILKLLPGSTFSKKKENYIDFSSVTSLCRNLIEAANIHWYISIENITTEEEILRFLIYDYHDTTELLIIVKQLKIGKAADIKYLEKQLQGIKTLLEQNVFFKTIDSQRRNLIIKGKQGALLTQYEIAQKRSIDFDRFKGIYKLLSNHTHTSANSIKMLGYSKVHDKKHNLNTILTILGTYPL